MGEAKRRKQLDPKWGKPKYKVLDSLITKNEKLIITTIITQKQKILLSNHYQLDLTIADLIKHCYQVYNRGVFCHLTEKAYVPVNKIMECQNLLKYLVETYNPSTEVVYFTPILEENILGNTGSVQIIKLEDLERVHSSRI
ncbi:hypothetical protein [Chroococcus sp. FPU101]|uniref:hypothetical protein n=1 Tax=Chroococcus sp. FPU101 TaxID=1974212 RepID=UPI001A8F94B0|nr:hypothetical protein [Chroococcus sp. FPU101]